MNRDINPEENFSIPIFFNRNIIMDILVVSQLYVWFCLKVREYHITRRQARVCSP
jgi:hypothetical protein